MLFSESEIKIGSDDMSGCIIRVISFNGVSKGIRDLFGFPLLLYVCDWSRKLALCLKTNQTQQNQSLLGRLCFPALLVACCFTLDPYWLMMAQTFVMIIFAFVFTLVLVF